MRRPDPAYVKDMSIQEFILGMMLLGKPIEISLVGVFDKEAQHGRGSRRDIELPPHRDGVYSAKLAAAQGGTYVEQSNITYVGLYCVREGADPVYTTLNRDDDSEIEAINLKAGQALIFNNIAVKHSRRGGPVGERVLLRMWVGPHKL